MRLFEIKIPPVAQLGWRLKTKGKLGWRTVETGSAISDPAYSFYAALRMTTIDWPISEDALSTG
jgi:hypothetical protein